jgi:hypothetical protein
LNDRKEKYEKIQLIQGKGRQAKTKESEFPLVHIGLG